EGAKPRGDGPAAPPASGGPATGGLRDRTLWAFVAAMVLFHVGNAPGGVYLGLFLKRDLAAPDWALSAAFVVSMVAWMAAIRLAGDFPAAGRRRRGGHGGGCPVRARDGAGAARRESERVMSLSDEPVVFMVPGDLHLTGAGLDNHRAALWVIGQANGLIRPDFV